jgi:hypothetical protein
VSEWRSETASDLADGTRRLEYLIQSVAGEPSEDQVHSIWTAYLDVEKSIAFIKFDFGEENPGRFIKLKAYKVEDERQALRFALKCLNKGSSNFTIGEFRQALKDLRECRNYLRALLREQRLKRARRARST